MKKIISVVLILILLLSSSTTVFALPYASTDTVEKINNSERASSVNEDGWYYVEENDVVLYVKLEKDNYIVGDRITYAIQVVNYGDKCIGIENIRDIYYFDDILGTANGEFFYSVRLTAEERVPKYKPTNSTYNEKADKYYHFDLAGESSESDFIDGYAQITKAGKYTLVISVNYRYGEFDYNKSGVDNSHFIPSNDKTNELLLAIDIPVYESEADIPDTEIPVVPGPEKTKQSYYEKYPETPTSVLHEEPITVATTEVTTTENTTAAPSETIKQDASIIPSWIGYIIIALSVGVIITAVIIFVVVNKKRK